MNELTNLSPDIAFAIGLVGLAPILARWTKIYFKLNLNFAAFGTQIVKLIKSDNMDRALKLCSVIPHAYGTGGVVAMLKAAEAGNSTRQMLQTTWARAVESSRIQLRFMLLPSVIGLLLTLVPAAQVALLDAAVTWKNVGPAAAGLFMFGGSQMTASRMPKATARMSEDIIQALAEGGNQS